MLVNVIHIGDRYESHYFCSRAEINENLSPSSGPQSVKNIEYAQDSTYCRPTSYLKQYALLC